MKKEKVELLNSKVEQLISVVQSQKKKIVELEKELQTKKQDLSHLIEETKILIDKVQQFNKVFEEYPLFNNDSLITSDNKNDEWNKDKWVE
ncbi:MAG: hypothetical protein KBG82_02270 [Spirochaetes bacterium]|nr:hypothetical protein [Spirochaetota bacterium]NLJ04784.1 hypothetical protein [Exilispira sp.]MBP8990785.1 hypothetical protein [Spirochaetota bacterium]HNV44636.1 hypothetical protein [Exilispira sp.]HOV46473.1 hypothetical protein [Exilispira sp.]